MRTKPLTYRTIPIEWRDSSKWPKADISTLDKSPRARFDRLSAAVAMYFRNGRLKDAADAACCSQTVFIRQVNRCVSLGTDGRILGWAGLIENLRLKEYERREPLPSGAEQAAHGSSGSFKRFLLEHPRMHEILDDAIVKGVGKKNVRPSKNTVKSVWKLFCRECKKEVAPDEYPRNSATGGRRSVERYVKLKLGTDSKALGPWIGRDSAKALNVGNGNFSFELAQMPMDMAGIDAHIQDCIGVIIIDGPAGPQPVAVKRIWIYGYIDTESRAALGYGVSIRSEPTSSQIDAAVNMSLSPWKKRDIKMAGVYYKDGAGFPCGNVDGLTACLPSAIRADNGMAGYARLVTHRVRRKLGCALSYGAVGAWWHNAIIERVFLRLERCGFQLLPSSTGTNACDPMRGDAVKQAIKHQILWDELVDLVDVAFANYNAEPQSGLGHRSPLDVLRDCFNPLHPRLQPRLLAPPTVATPELGISVECATVRGTRRPGKVRAPYVQVDKCTYTNSDLATRHDLVGTPLTLHIKEDDMRTIKAFLPSGQGIGELMVRERGWKRTKHTRETRKKINRLRDSGDLQRDPEDFIVDYMTYLAGKAVSDAKKRPNKISHAATELAETVRTTGQSVPKVPEVQPLRLVSNLPVRPVPSQIKRPSWE